MSLLAAIKRLRKQKGLTQGQMAEKIGVERQVYQQLESGTTRLDTDRLAQIAAVLGKTPIEIYEENAEEQSLFITQNNENKEENTKGVININKDTLKFYKKIIKRQHKIIKKLQMDNKVLLELQNKSK